MTDITDIEALRAHFGAIRPLADRKVLPILDRHCRAFIQLSPLLVLATADASGDVDASPRGDPPGFVRVLDETTLLIPDRPGNNRVDSFSNLLERPGIGLIFFVPGIDETLRVNGSARLSTDPADLDPLTLSGKAPRTALQVTVHQAYFHCGKALKRAKLWDPSSRVERSAFPTLGRVLADQIANVSADEADANLERAYKERLY